MRANGMRNIVGLGKWGDRNKRHTESKLVEVRASQWVRTRLTEFGAKVGGVILAETAIGATTWALAGRRIGEVCALARTDSVGAKLAALQSGRRSRVIVESTVFVVGDV